MSQPRLIRWNSLSQLRAQAADWDDLWLRSGQTAPTARAEPLAQWVEHFAPTESFCVLAVEHHGQLLAALPLVGRRLKGLIELASLPANCWSAAGELLVDPHSADSTAADLLAASITALPWPLLWLDGVHPHTPGWRWLLAALDRTGLAHEFHPEYDVGLVDIGDDWPAFEAGWSKSHRKNMRKTRERLEQAGAVELVVRRDVTAEQVEPLLRQAFGVEDRSWKGLAGTSVLRSPGILEFFVAQARQLASWNHLEVSLLQLAGEAIAFEYGYRAQGVYYSHKVGYDERFASFGPGQLLMLELLRRFHADPEIALLDCLGPLSEAVGRWTTRTYPVGRLIITPRRLFSRALLGTYHLAQPWARRVRQHWPGHRL